MLKHNLLAVPFTMIIRRDCFLVDTLEKEPKRVLTL